MSIYALTKASATIRDSTIAEANKDLILALVECARNVLLGNVHLTTAQLNSLRRHRRAIEDLTNSRTSVRQKKLILQRGGFLGLLLKPLASLLGGVLGGLGGGRR